MVDIPGVTRPATEQDIKKEKAPTVDITPEFETDPRRLFQSQLPPTTITPLQQGLAEEEVKKAAPGTLEILKASFRLDNTIGSTIANIRNGSFTRDDFDQNFDVIPHLQGTKYEPYLVQEINEGGGSFLSANSVGDVDSIKVRIDEEEEARKVMAEAYDDSPVKTSMISLASGLADLINLVPIGGVAYKAFKTGKIVKNAVRGAEVAALSSAAVEGVLHAQQETRTVEESVVNIAGSAILGSVIGGAVASLSKGDFDKMATSLSQDRNRIVQDKPRVTIDENSSLSAAEAPKTTSEQESLGGGKIAQAVIKSTEKLNPMLRIFQGSSAEAKRTMQGLVRTNMVTKKNAEGIGSVHSVAINKLRWQAGLNIATEENTRLAMAANKRMSKAPLASARFRTGIKPTLSLKDFNDAVSLAMIRGDKSEIPEVEQAAKIWRKHNINPLKDGAIEQGLLHPDVNVKTAPSYLMRMYNRNKIIAREPEFRKIIETGARTRLIPGIQKSFRSQEETLFSRINEANTRALELKDLISRSKESLLKEGKGRLEISDKEALDLLERFKEARNIQRSIKPKSLLQFIRDEGGITDAGGELEARGVTNKTFPGLIRKDKFFKKTTLQGEVTIKTSLDDVALRAWEGGYFPELSERPSINNLLNAIDDEISGNKRFSELELDQVQIKADADEFIAQLDEFGVDINKIKSSQDLNVEVNGQAVKKLLIDREIKSLEAKKIRLEDRARDLRILIDAHIGDQASIDIYVKEIVDNVVNNIRGLERKGATMPYDLTIGVRGPAKERILNFVTDEELRPFLETDILKIAKSYTNIMSSDIEMKRQFGRVDMQDQLDAVSREYTELRAKAKTEKERNKLKTEEDQALEILKAFRDLVRGNYGVPENPDAFWRKALHVSRTIQYTAKLGGVLYSSLADAARHIQVHGMNRVFGKGIKNVIFNTKAIKLSVADAKLAGNIGETISHHRIGVMADLADPYSSNSKFVNFLNSTSGTFSKLNLLSYWNNYQKAFASVLTQQRMIENINNFGKLKPGESQYMAFLGIDKNNVGMIEEQIKRFSTKEGGLDIANLDKWDNAEAARIYKNAMNTDVERTIVTKGEGDVPILMNNELMKTVLQFKSFALAAHQQVLIAGLQQGDAAFINGTVAMITMGMMVYYLKTVSAGRELSDDPKVWIAEGVDRSGLISVLAEVNGVADIFGFGAGSVLGSVVGEEPKPLSRYATRNRASSLLGPSFGGAVDLGIFSSAITAKLLADGEIKESDIRAARRNIPYQNLFYFRKAFDTLEQELADSLDAAE